MPPLRGPPELLLVPLVLFALLVLLVFLSLLAAALLYLQARVLLTIELQVRIAYISPFQFCQKPRGIAGGDANGPQADNISGVMMLECTPFLSWSRSR
jgi:hypothetical protein